MPLENAALPGAVERALAMFVDAARAALGEDLRSIVLYGSAAEGRLRETSDVNVIVVLARFERDRVDALREPLRTAHAAIALEAMFLLEAEIDAAVEAFAVKFADVRQRHRVLHGADPFAERAPSRAAELARLRQVLLNLVLRLRQRYVLSSLRDEQMAAVIADTAGPLRACAEALLELRGTPAPSPKAALGRVGAELGEARFSPALAALSRARETRALPPGEGAAALLGLIGLAEGMQAQVQALRESVAP